MEIPEPGLGGRGGGKGSGSNKETWVEGQWYNYLLCLGGKGREKPQQAEVGESLESSVKDRKVSAGPITE